MSEERAVERLAPAKVNLTLAVLGRRPDGFHALHSVMVPVGLADRLVVRRAAGPRDELEVDGHDAGPLEANLVLRAVAAARAAVGAAAAPPLAIRLEKRIPVAAGLAGGSSDAAAALDAALASWRLALPAAERLALAASLGSDVPFFLAAGPALVEGRGERCTPLPPPAGPPAALLLVTPAIAMSTPAVFAALDAGGPGAPPAPGATRLTSEHLVTELRAGLSTAKLIDRAGVLATANDLAAAAAVVAPGIVPFRRALRRLLDVPVGMSGSGPTLWALYPSLAAAATAVAAVDEALSDGSVTAPGSGRPNVAAAVILSGDRATPAAGDITAEGDPS